MPSINATNLRLLRDKRNLTLDALEQASGVNRVTISRIENKRIASCRKTTLERLATALATDVDTLTGPDLDGADQLNRYGRKTQMNVRMADDARNALRLVARRYQVNPSHILHIAPFLFLWAAETSLARRSKALDELCGLWDQLGKGPAARHLNGLISNSWRADEVIDAERASIAARDIFGTTIPDEHLAFTYEDSEQNPMAAFLASLAADFGDQIQFEYWSPGWDQPGYTLGREEAEAMTGGDEQAAHQIVNGYAPLHELPKEIENTGPQAVAAWARATGDAYRKEHFADFEMLLGGDDA